MLELLLSSGAEISVDYPDSGPGTKKLRHGDEQLGYFGEVSQSELFTLADLMDQTSFWTPVPYRTLTWVKMFYKDDVIFFPLTPIASSTSWNSLYEAGLVYGDNTNGKYPTANPTPQNKMLFKGRDNFRIRLFKVSNTDPEIISTTVTIATNSYREAEWGSIVMSLLNPRQIGYTGVNWGLYPIEAIGGPVAGNNVPSLNTQQQDNRRSCTFGPTVVSIADKSASGLWHPLLILDKTTPVQRPPGSITVRSDQGGDPLIAKEVSYVDQLHAPISFSANSLPPGHSIVTKEIVTDGKQLAPSNLMHQMYTVLPIKMKAITYE